MQSHFPQGLHQGMAQKINVMSIMQMRR